MLLLSSLVVVTHSVYQLIDRSEAITALTSEVNSVTGEIAKMSEPLISAVDNIQDDTLADWPSVRETAKRVSTEIIQLIKEFEAKMDEKYFELRNQVCISEGDEDCKMFEGEFLSTLEGAKKVVSHLLSKINYYNLFVETQIEAINATQSTGKSFAAPKNYKTEITELIKRLLDAYVSGINPGFMHRALDAFLRVVQADNTQGIVYDGSGWSFQSFKKSANEVLRMIRSVG